MPKILFSAQNAAEYARKSWEIRKARAAAESANPTQRQPTILPTAAITLPADDFASRRLSRVRKQCSLIDTAIENELKAAEPDASALDRLASASAKLSELARVLAGVPLPGSHRPQAPRRQSPGSGPVVPE